MNRTFAGAALAAICIPAAPVAAQDAEWVSTLEGRAPAEMGLVLLGERDHAEIVEIVDRTMGMTPPGMRDYALLERPVRMGDACQRVRWDVTAGISDGLSTRSAYARRQVALAPADPCEFADYATLADGIEDEQGVELLRMASALHETGRPLECGDETASDLCRTDNYLRLQLRYLTATRIARDGDSTVVWFGEPFTEVRVPDDEGSPIAVVRRVPAVF
ncbi:hypothetical protein [Aurantiacibacter luteus]|uniref:Uncharacterized protein n=1 Tax=Aurantiacibacter luteus TaxID=1581420 RepID=A0A0G9MSW3_9SPHN|nr:hypothetical protein [Aurantiacibacter luteus]KLE33805.1 hypothetical protein AAW00_12035 [Aurantiacibacter luteus]